MAGIKRLGDLIGPDGRVGVVVEVLHECGAPLGSYRFFRPWRGGPMDFEEELHPTIRTSGPLDAVDLIADGSRAADPRQADRRRGVRGPRSGRRQLYLEQWGSPSVRYCRWQCACGPGGKVREGKLRVDRLHLLPVNLDPPPSQPRLVISS